MTRELEIVERDEVPRLSVIFGYGPMLPFLVGAVASWRLTGVWRGEAVLLTVVWAATILAFLAGVRRGLSFRTEGEPAPAQIVTMFGLFVLALGVNPMRREEIECLQILDRSRANELLSRTAPQSPRRLCVSQR